MGKRISEETKNQIPILYSQLHSQAKVAEKLQISVSTVRKYLNLYEATPTKEQPKSPEKVQSPEINQDLINQINTLYSQCRNMSQVGRELNISTSIVKKHLTEENLNYKKKELEDRDALWYYIYRLFGQYSEDKPVSDWNIVQMQKFKRQGIPYRGQLLTLKYFYEVEKHDIERSNGSIGIIPWAIKRAESYYRELAKRTDEMEKAIERQLEQDRIEIKYNPSNYIGKKRKKRLIDINELEEE